MLRPLAAVLVGLVCAPSQAAILTVHPDGSGDYPTIQAAIDASVDGDVVELGDGVFAGFGNRDIDFVGKAITVRSASGDPEACVIDGEDFSRCVLMVNGEGPDTVLENVTLVRGRAGVSGGGILCMAGASPVVRGCRVLSCWGGGAGGGIAGLDGSSIRIEDCLVAGNEGASGGGIFTSGPAVLLRTAVVGNRASFEGGGGGTGGGLHMTGTPPTLSECTVAGNAAHFDAGGIWAITDGVCVLENTVLWGNCAPEGSAATVEIGSALEFRCSDVDSAGVGGPGTVQYVADNLFGPPLFCAPAPCDDAPTEAGDYRLAENSPCLADPVCGQIGALGPGCGPLAVEPASWARIKARYR